MKLFISKDETVEIFLSIWEWCPTWCQSCSQTLKKTKNYKLEDLKLQIDTAHSQSDERFVFFLYWSRDIENTHLSEIINYISNLGRKIRLQLPIESKKKDISKYIYQIKEYVISKKISNSTECKDLFRNISEFYKENIIINYDLLVWKTYIDWIERILGVKFNKRIDWTLNLKLNNIIINIRDLYIIDSKNRKIDNLNISSCYSYESFQLKEDFIQINDHYEIDSQLNIIFHNPLCFIGNNKISNLRRDRKLILNDFKKYKNMYLEKLNDNYRYNCYKCITTWFRYDEKS